MDEPRWPTSWFERLVRNLKLNDREYRDYAESFQSLGLTPDPSVHEDFANDRGEK